MCTLFAVVAFFTGTTFGAIAMGVVAAGKISDIENGPPPKGRPF